MKNRFPGTVRPLVVLIATSIFGGAAYADNYVGTSQFQGGTAYVGVSSGQPALMNNTANTQIYSNANSGIYLLNSNSTYYDLVNPTVNINANSPGVTMAVTAADTTINSTRTNITGLLNTGGITANNVYVDVIQNRVLGTTSLFAGSWDFSQATITGLGGSFNPAAAGALGAVTTLNAGSTYNVDLTTGAAALGAVSTGGITNTGNIATTTLSTSGLATLDSAAITNNATVGGTLAVTGATTLSGATAVNNTLNVTGATTIVGATNINTTGSAATDIGNSAPQTTVRATAGNSRLTLENGEARLTVSNSLGNTHGLVVGESSTTLSGGTSSTNLTLNDNGATFSNAATGAPTRVTGVANGSGDFDAVNVRQFSSAVAGVAASANIPGLDTNKAVSVGVGMGSFMNSQALAFGGSYRFSDKGVLRASLATGLNNGGGKTSFGIGAGWSW